MIIAYIVEPRKVIGGGVRAALNLAKSMKEYYGEESVIFGVHRDGVKDVETPVYEVDTLEPISFGFYKEYKKFINNFKPDIVHCLGLFSALMCIIHRKWNKADYKIVCTVHRVTMNLRFRALTKLIIDFIARNLDYVTFLTPYQQEHYFKNVGFKPERFTIVPNVIFVQDYNDKAKIELKEKFKSELNCDYVTTYVGRIIPSKNIEDTVRTVSRVNKLGVNLGCVLVGGYDDEYKALLDRVISEENIAEKIKFVGYVNNPTLYIGAADFTTTTTHGEALPNLMVESFALGKVVFSSDIPQMCGLISDRKNGFTISLENLDIWAEKIVKFLKDNAIRADMEREAAKTYATTYEPHSVAKIYHDVYLKI